MSATASIVLKVVTDKGRCVFLFASRSDGHDSQGARRFPRRVARKAQNADPSVKRARRATFPSFCS